MSYPTWQRGPNRPDEPSVPDAFALGRRLHGMRRQNKMTLAEVGKAIEATPSHLSLIENGKREPKLTLVSKLAALYGVTLDELTTGTPSRRTQLEIELEAAMNSPLAVSKGLPPIRVGPRTPTDVLEAMLALHHELNRVSEEHIATPEEARRANTALRHEMRARNNYFEELEREASNLLRAIKHTGGPLTGRDIGALTKHLDFRIHHVDDLPNSTRSVTDLHLRRIYMARSPSKIGHDPRSVLLQALGHQVLGHTPPRDYAEFLRQRVETNYLAGALFLPEISVLARLHEAKTDWDLSVEAIEDSFAVSYETAAHRLTNLITQHLGLPIHFQKVHVSGTIYKAYENDGTIFPMDHTGAIEGQPVCRYSAARQVFERRTDSSYQQYTDTPNGTYWDTVKVEMTPNGAYSIGIGTPFVHVKWFRGSDTRVRTKSTCPDENCCRKPPPELLERWAGNAWPSTRARTHMMAALPPGAFPGVDETEVYSFLEAHRNKT